MFAHEKLDVFQKAKHCYHSAIALVTAWERKHAVRDQLARSSESIVLNIAKGTSLRLGKSRIQSADYALGSTLESAAGLDVAVAKEIVTSSDVLALKEGLAEVARMLVGLRTAWIDRMVREDGAAYETADHSGEKALFNHETLDVYQVALEFVRWFTRTCHSIELTSSRFRELDKESTALVLHIAEGNGRFAELDHKRFIELAEIAAVKAATYLDIWLEGTLPDEELRKGKILLDRCVAMLTKLGGLGYD